MPTFHDRNQLTTLLKGVRVICPAKSIDRVTDVLIGPEGIELDSQASADRVIDANGMWATPGLTDLQVHFREPGFEYKETIASGSKAALAGGITTVVVMPNTKPALDSAEEVERQHSLSKACDGVRVLVAAGATKDIQGHELSDYEALKSAGAVAVTDDGYPLANSDIMLKSLEHCAQHDLLFMQHAEDLTLSKDGVMTEGPTSKRLGLAGQLADAEGAMVERDVALALKTGARYHVLHMSTQRSLNAVREARSKGAKVTCEVSPHHLLLTDADVDQGGTPDTHFKMNPPLRAEHDRLALIEGLRDGTVDAVATDHAPHSAEEKARDFAKAPFGIVGLETAFASVLRFVHDETISDQRAVELMTSGPARVLNRPELAELHGDLTLIDPNYEWVVSESDFCGAQKNSPFTGQKFKGRVRATFKDGALRYTHDLEV